MHALRRMVWFNTVSLIFQIPLKNKKPGQANCSRIEHAGEWHSFLVKIVAQRYDFSDSSKKSGG